jgi:hypothetical protein
VGTRLEQNLCFNIAEVACIYGKDKLYKMDPIWEKG